MKDVLTVNKTSIARAAFAFLCVTLALGPLIACNGTSSNGSTSLATAKPGPTPRFLYAASCAGSSNGGINEYGVDAASGALAPLSGSPFLAGLDCPNFMTVNPEQTFLFVPDDEEEQIHVYAIASNGALSEIPRSPYSQCAFQLAVDPSGRFLVAPNFCDNSVGVYSIGSDGTLSAVAGSPFRGATTAQPVGVLIDPRGQRVFVANEGTSSNVSVFTMSSNGVLSEVPGSPFAAGDSTYALSETPDGKYLFANDFSSGGQILVYAVSGSTGSLTLLTKPAYPGGPCWDSIDEKGVILFSTDCEGNLSISIISSDGTLTPAAGSPAAIGTSLFAVIGDPSGAFVYTADSGNPGSLFAYRYSVDGALTPISGSPLTARGDFFGLVVTY